MKRKQVTAILLSAIMTVSACMPVNGIAVFAAENAGAESTEAAVVEEQDGESAFAAAEETEAPAAQVGAEATAAQVGAEETAGEAEEEAAEEQEAASSQEEAGEVLSEKSEEEPAETEAEAPAEQNETAETPAEQKEAAEASVQDSTAAGQADASNSKVAEAAQDKAADGSAQTIEEDAKEESGKAALGALPPEAFENYYEISAGETIQVSVGEEQDYAICKFTPDESGIYRFYSETGDVYRVGSIYDFEYHLLKATEEWNWAVEFSLEQFFSAGKTYYLVVSTDMPAEGTSIPVSVEKMEMPDFYVEGEEGIAKVIWADPGEKVTLSLFVQSPTDKVYYEWSDERTGESLGTSDSCTITADQIRYIACVITDGPAGDFNNYVKRTLEVRVQNHLTAYPEGADDPSDDYANINIDLGESMLLRAIASADDNSQLTYMWSRNETITNSWGETYLERVPIPGEETNEIETGPLTKNTDYYCQVSDQYGNSVELSYYINVENLKDAYPEGSDNPYDDTAYYFVDYGSDLTLSFHVEAVDESVLSYTWFRIEEKMDEEGDPYTEYVIIEDADAAQYKLTNITQKGKYSCEVSDQSGDYRTVYFDIRIENHLTVVAEGSEEEDTSVAYPFILPGSSVTLRAIASADDASQLEYQWFNVVEMSNDWGEVFDELEPIEGANTAEYYIEEVDGGRYQCMVSDQFGNSVYAQFYIQSDNHLRAFPEGAFEDETSRFLLVKPFESATLKVTALAEDMSQITYQWQEAVVTAEESYDDEDIYSDIEGANEDTYEADSSRNLAYRCKVSDQYENAAYVYFYLEVNNELRAYPEGAEEGSRTVEIYPAPGDTITLKVNPSAIDVSQLAYEWYDDDDNELDSDGPELVLNNVTKAKRYRCRVSDQYGNRSNAYFYIRFENHLNVHPAGTRNTDYVYLKAEPHAPLTLRVVAEADDTSQLTYEWRGDYETIDGADADTYTIPSVEERMEYDCTVTDQYDNQGAVRFYVEVDNKFTAYPEGAEEGQYLVELYADYGKPLTLKAIASAIDEEGITYRWGSNEYGWYDDASEDEFTISSVTNRGDYWCLVEDAFGNSEQLYFDVHIENHFDVYPEGYKGHDTAYLYVKPGTKVTLNAVVEGDDTGDVHTYWYRDDRWEDIETEEPSITVDAKNAVYIFDASDKYGNFEYTKFVLRLVNGLTAYPEGASMDENGRYQYFVNLYPKAGEQLDLNVIASSDEGALSYEWYEKAAYETSWGEYETDYEPMKDAGNTASVRVTAAKATSYCCTVSDEYGNEQDVEFYIHMGGAGFVAYPEGNEDTLNNRIAITAEQGKEMTLRVLTSGEEDAEYTYKWSEGPLNDSGWWPLAEGVDGTKDSLAVTPETSRRYLCVVTDQYGNQGMAYFYVNVNGMTVTTNQGTPALTGDNRYEIYVKAKAGDSVTLTTNVETEQADSLSYYWSYDNFDHASATIGSENSNSITIKAGAAKYYVNTIEDGTGNQVEVWYYFDIDNQLAVYPQEGVEDNTSVDIVTKVGEKLTLAPVVHATDMTKMEYVWSDSNGRSLGEDADLVLSVAREDVITCTVTDRFGTVRVVTYNILFKERPSIEDISQADITIGDVTYNGKAQLPMIGIYGGGRILIEGTDYTVTCGQNINAGTYPVTINGIGKLTGSVNREYKILKADQHITARNITLRPYETAKIKLDVDAKGALSYTTGSKAVTVADDGTVTAVKKGTAKITVTAAETDNYNQALTQLTVTVNAYDLSSDECKVTLDQTTAVYSGKEIKPTATVKFGDVTLTEGTDYTVSYENNVNAGNAALTITGNGTTTENSAKAAFTIAKASQVISSDAPADGLKIKVGESAKITVSGAQGDVTFASGDTAVATVAADGASDAGAGGSKAAGAAVTATVSAVKVGSTKITVNAAETDNYEAAKALEIVVKVVPATIDVSELQITVDDSGLVYDGKAKTPKVTVKNDGAVLTEGFTVSYQKNVNAGVDTAKAIVTGDNVTLSGTKEVAFTILPGKTTRGDMFNLANNVKVTWQAVPGAKYYKVYRTGVTSASESRKEPVIVTAGLVGWDKDPGLTNGNAYRYTIVASLTGKGDASGDSPKSYSKLMYRLKTVVIRSAKNTAPGKVTVKYDKTTSGDSYVLQYCERQDMVGAKTKVVLGANNTSYVIGGLKKGKTYYISIRVRKKVNGIDYYTTFGVPKKVTITK